MLNVWCWRWRATNATQNNNNNNRCNYLNICERCSLAICGWLYSWFLFSIKPLYFRVVLSAVWQFTSACNLTPLSRRCAYQDSAGASPQHRLGDYDRFINSLYLGVCACMRVCVCVSRLIIVSQHLTTEWFTIGQKTRQGQQLAVWSVDFQPESQYSNIAYAWYLHMCNLILSMRKKLLTTSLLEWSA